MLSQFRNYLVTHFDWGLLAAVAITLPIIFPFLQGQLPNTADAQLHLHRMVSVGLSIDNGVLYPRWAPHLHAGYGYPLHNFYAPGWHIIAGGLYSQFGGDAVHYWLAAQAIGVMLAGVGAYLFARTFAPRYGALIAAAAFTWSPIRFREIWDQGNISQLIGMGLIAWGFWAIARLAQRPSPSRVGIVGLIIGFLIINHHPTAFFFMPAAGLYAVFVGWLATSAQSWQQIFQRISLCVVAYGLGLLVATIYWLPAALENQYVLLDQFTTGQYDFRNHFVPLSELLSNTPLIDRSALIAYRPLNVGTVHLIMVMVGFVSSGLLYKRFTGWQRGHLFLSGVPLLFCLYLITDASTWFWETVPLADRFIYPWRLLALIALLIVPSVALLPQIVPPKWRYGVSIGAIVLFIVSMLPAAYAKGEFLPEYKQPITAATAHDYERTEGVVGMVSGNEYLPKWTSFTARPDSAPDPNFYQSLDWYFTYNFATLPPEVTIEQATQANHRTGEQFIIETPIEFDFQIRQLYFPGWQATLNGESIEVFPTTEEGLLTVQLPAGNHTVEVWYGGTHAQNIAEIATLLGILICLGLIGWGAQRQASHPDHKPIKLADQRFSIAIVVLAVGWTVFNQVYIIPETDWFRPQSPVDTPYEMETIRSEWFFQPNIGYRLALLGYTLPDQQLAAGDSLALDIYWRALQPFDRSPDLKVSVMSCNQQQLYAEFVVNPIGGINPNKWPIDRYVWQPLQIPINEAITTDKVEIHLHVSEGSDIWYTQSETESMILHNCPE